MNFLKRLKFYLIGVGLGILMVMAIFKDRKLTSWTPQNQVIKDIQEKEFRLNANTKCWMDCLGINEIDSLISLMSEAEVNFSESDVKDHDKRKYRLLIEESTITQIDITIFPDTVEINRMLITGIDCFCP